MAETVTDMSAVSTLVQICTRYVAEHMDVLESQAWDLPSSLLQSILPHLNILYLDRIERAAQLKGVSTYGVWAAIWRDLHQSWRCSRSKSQQGWKLRCLERLFHLVLLTGVSWCKPYLSGLTDQSVLSLAAPPVRVLFLTPVSAARLASPALRSVLTALEGGVRSVRLDGAWPDPRPVLYVLHRLLDHGSVREVALRRCRDPDALLAWITARCGRDPTGRPAAQCQDTAGPAGGCRGPSRWADSGLREEEEAAMSPKRRRLSLGSGAGSEELSTGSEVGSEELSTGAGLEELSAGAGSEELSAGVGAGSEELSAGLEQRGSMCSPSVGMRAEGSLPLAATTRCEGFDPGSRGACPRGWVGVLDLEVSRCERLRTVTRLLPRWSRLRSLHLHSEWLLQEQEVCVLLECLRRLGEAPGCRLAELSVSPAGMLPLTTLLWACPHLTSLTLDLHTPTHTPSNTPAPEHNTPTVFPLERLCVRSVTVPMGSEGVLAALRRAPRLTHLHLAGSCPANLLLPVLTECCPLLVTLHLEDMSLATCLTQILHLLQASALQELSLRDCRLLDRSPEKSAFLQPLVSALRRLPSLHTLALPQNRLASGVMELAKLFSGSPVSNITKLDLSSNFILSVELLEFGRRLAAHPPQQRLTFDLRLNPLDRDLEVKERALTELLRCGDVLTDSWDSRSTMVDHVSVM